MSAPRTIEAATKRARALGLNPIGSADGSVTFDCPICRRDGYTNQRASAEIFLAKLRAQCNGCDDAEPGILAALGEPATTPARLRLYTAAEVKALPPPEYIIDGHLVANSLAVLYGPSGHGKSFLALDWALSVSTGRDWLGRGVTQGDVVYVLAEGASGFGPRMTAWQTDRRIGDLNGIRFAVEPIDLLGELGLVKRADLAGTQPPPTLIVIDTLARSMVGGDENSSRDVGIVIDHAEQLRRATTACVLIVHHSGVAGDRERGSTALRGALQTVFEMKAENDAMHLTCIKQKDNAPCEPWRLYLKNVAESCVLSTAREGLAVLTTAEAELLEDCHAAFGSESASTTALKQATTLSDRTFYRAKKALVDRGFLIPDGTRWKVSPAGLNQLLPTTANVLPGSGLTTAATCHSLRSGSGVLSGGTDDTLEAILNGDPGTHADPDDWGKHVQRFEPEEAS